MLKVNIRVGTADLNWIAGRLARELEARLPAYDVEAHINWPAGDLHYEQIVYGAPELARDVPAVGLFTHGENRAKTFAPCYHGHVALNPRIAQVLRETGAKKPVVIEQAVDAPFIRNAPMFGVAGSVKAGGRKGEALVQKMVEAGYNVRVWGSGWPIRAVSNIYEHLPAFYAGLDYYVVTSEDEGGCTPIIECMAMNVPVISPRIGFAIDRPVLEYQAGDWDSLHRVLRYLTEHRTYDDWARDHAAYFKTVMACA